MAKHFIRVNVKLVPGSDQALLLEAVSSLPGIVNITQTFPGETDQEPANLYLLEVDNSQIKPALRKLRAMAGVEYAEEAAPRKLIRGIASARA